MIARTHPISQGSPESHRHCPRCAHYFNPPPDELPRACPTCGLPIRLHAVTGRVVALGLAAAMLLAAAPAEARKAIRDYPTWMSYAACVNGPNGIGRPGHSERYCRLIWNNRR